MHDDVRASVRALLAVAPQLSRYAMVSVAALAVDVAVYVWLIGLGAVAGMAGVFGYATGLALHYALTTRFVFDATHLDKSEPRIVAEFAASGLLGVAVTAAIITIATDMLTMSPLAAKGIAAAVSFFAVYALRRVFVFAPTAPALETSS